MAENPTNPEQRFELLEGDVLSDLDANSPQARLAAHHDLRGCFSLIPPVSICYTFIPPNRFRVCLNVAGIDVVCQEVAASGDCIVLEYVTPILKLRVKICVVVYPGRICLTYEAEICHRTLGGWQCYRLAGTIICIPT